MNLQKYKSFKISILVSIIIHAFAIFNFAYIKFGVEKKIVSEIPVTFIGGQKQAIFQRRTPIKKLVYSSYTQISGSKQPTYVSSSHRMPSGINANLINAMPSELINIGYEMLESPKPLHTGFRQSTNALIDRPQNLPKWKPAKAKMANPDGYKLMSKGLLGATLDNKHFSVDLDDILQGFFSSVRNKIESHRRYPKFARNAGIEGRSGVKITILKSGQLEKVEIVDSSGSEILDDAAMQSIHKASPFPPIPMSLGQDRIELSLYLVFKIASNS